MILRSLDMSSLMGSGACALSRAKDGLPAVARSSSVRERRMVPVRGDAKGWNIPFGGTAA